jgi:hypothetical protein
MANVNEEEIRILKNIEKLQNMEKSLYQELESGSNISSDSPANWSKIGQEGSYVTVGPNTTVRYGLPGKYIESVKSGGFIVTNATMGGDPAPGSLKIVESKSNNSASMSSKNVDSIVNRINQLSEVRMSLYKSLNYTYQSLQKSVNTSRTELVELLTVVSIVEDELNNAKIQLNQLYEIKHNKMRMVEINTYYGKRYKAQSSVMKLIIFVCVIILVLAILQKKSLLPESIANILLGIVIVIGGFFIIWRILDISRRDNMNFDEYNWYFNPEAQQKTPYDYTSPQVDINLPKIDCIGNACCTDGMIYDAKIRKCIKSVAPETFVSGQLTKHCFNNKPDGEKQTMTNPIPYGSDETINFASV